MSQKTPNTNSEGHYWRPGMNWFKPKFTQCAIDGCEGTFYKKSHTRRKYCDECKRAIEMRKLERVLIKKSTGWDEK